MLIDEAHSIEPTADGGYLVAGFSYSNDGDVTGNHGGADYWIVKLDGGGNLIWQKSFGGTWNDFGWSVVPTADGGCVVGGSSSSNDGDVTGNHGAADYWIVKLDGPGNLTWQKSFGGSIDEYLYSIQQTTDGGYIVGGYSDSNDGDVTGNHGGYDYWIVKLDSIGNLTWQKSLGGSITDVALFVQQTNDNGYIVAGESQSNDGDVSVNLGDNDYWIVKLDSTGAVLWEKSLGGSDIDWANYIEQTTDGGYIVAGYSNSTDGDVTGNHFRVDYWIVKLDSIGAITWQKSLGGSDGDRAYAMQQTSDLGYIVIGSSPSNDGDVTGNHGNQDYWLVKLTSNGLLDWQKSLGGSENDEAYAVKETADGGYIIAGYSQSNDGDVTSNYGDKDYWIVKLSFNVGIAEGLKQVMPDVFPNPTTDQITMTVDAQQIGATYTIYDNRGRAVLSNKIATLKTVIELENLSNGTYLLHVDGIGNQSFKVVKN